MFLCKKNVSLLLLSLVITNLSFGQYFKWARQISGTEAEYVLDMTTDPSGNVISTGYFSGSVDFNSSPGTTVLTATAGSGYPDMFVQKLDANGNLLWVKSFGNAEWEHGDAVKTDAAGNVYIIGQFKGTVDVDPGAGTFMLTSKAPQSYDVFLIKLDATGNFVWAVQRQSLNSAEEYTANADLVLDNNNNIYMVYSFMGFSSKRNYMMIEKTTSVGAGIWQYKVESNGFGGGDIKDHSITLDANDSVLVAGTFSGEFRFNAALSSGLLGSVYVLKLNNSGNYAWVCTLWGSCTAHDIVTDASSDIFIAGDFSGIVDFDPGAPFQRDTASSSFPSMYMLKLKNTGVYEWAKNFTGTNGSTIVALAVDKANNLYATGTFWGQLNFTPTIVKNTLNDDVFTMRFTNSGNVEWVKQMGGSGSCWPYAIALSNAADVYTAGVFQATANFDMDGPGYYLTKTGTNFIGTDPFICKHGSCPDFRTSVSQDGSALTVTASVGTYQWINCAGKAPIFGAMDSIYTAETTGSYAVVVTQGNCSDTSACFTVLGTGIKETQLVSKATLHPNPSNGTFTIKSADKKTLVYITNIYGQQVIAAQNHKGSDIHVSLNVPPGVYFVTISNAYGKQTVRITVR